MSAESSKWLLGFLITLTWKAPLYFQGISWTIIKNCSILSNHLQQSFCPSQNIFLIHFFKMKPRVQHFSCPLWSSSSSSARLAPRLHYTNPPPAPVCLPYRTVKFQMFKSGLLWSQFPKGECHWRQLHSVLTNHNHWYIFLHPYTHSLLLSRSHQPWSSNNNWPLTHPHLLSQRTVFLLWHLSSALIIVVNLT